MPCRVALDWISCLIEIVATIFFIVGFSTNHWAESNDSSANSGLFTTCKTNGLCYDTHVFYDANAEKGQIMGAAVLTMLVMAGFCLVLVLMLLYMCGLFEEKSVGLLAAIVTYIIGVLGFIGIIIYGTAVTKISQRISWSCGLAIMGLLINLVAGICMHVGSQRFVANPSLPPPVPSSRVEPFTLSRHHLNRRLLSKRTPLLPQ